MKVNEDAGLVALVADEHVPPAIRERLLPRAARMFPYPAVDELVKEECLGRLRVLVIWTEGVPHGRLLPLLARLNVERPWVQKIALLDGPPPLVVAEYLTYCGVEVIWTGSVEERLEQVNVLVNRSEERTRWLGVA